MNRSTLYAVCLCCAVAWVLYPAPCFPLTQYRTSPDQVLVIYNADWSRRSDGTSADNDSREIAEYYVRRHTDPITGKKPYLLPLSCRHLLQRHLNDWFIKESSNDNANGVIYGGKGRKPADPLWIRDSRAVEIKIDEPAVNWDSVRITCRSETSGEEVAVTPLRTGFQVSGIPDKPGDAAVYPPVSDKRGRTFRFDASAIFSGPVTVTVTARDLNGEKVVDLSLSYYDSRDFTFTSVGADGIPDDAVVEEDVLRPVRDFLTDPRNALPDGTLLRDHILYIVVVHGMPYAAKSVYGTARGVTGNPNDHGTLASLEQRLQTIFYPWDRIRPPIIPFYFAGGPEADRGAVNRIVTTAMRRSQTGSRWNPYMHPDTYSFLRRPPTTPEYVNLPPLAEQRRSGQWMAYGVSRIDGETVNDAKRLVDYAIYATRYLRPEMDCRVRKTLKAQGKKSLDDLEKRLVESENAWGREELEILGFGPVANFSTEGLPFLSRPADDGDGACAGAPDWQKAGFYPGGMERKVISSNGLNYKTADIWKHLRQGVTVSAAGSPAYGGGPHITNASFWDNRILLKYLLRGRDLGEAFLRATTYVNWSTSLIGDPLLHPDLTKTVLDEVPPRPAGEPTITFESGLSTASATISLELADDAIRPEVALLTVTARGEGGDEQRGVSTLYSRRPRAIVEGLTAGAPYLFTLHLTDPYGNVTELPALSRASGGIDVGKTLMKRLLKGKEKR